MSSSNKENKVVAETQWNIPDWRDPSQYPDPDKTYMYQWRWEFVRRSKAYRNDWLEYSQNKEEWVKQRECGITKDEEVGHSYGLSMLIDPNGPGPIPQFGQVIDYEEQPVIPAFYHPEEVEYFCNKARHKGRYLVSIDPTQFLDNQFDRIREQCKSWQKDIQMLLPQDTSSNPKTARARRDRYPLYLRLLDAHEDVTAKLVKWRIVAQHLSKERGMHSYDIVKVKDMRQQANKTQMNFLKYT